jgi:hypothetical protein
MLVMQFNGMAELMETDVSLCPADIGLLCPIAVVP